MGLAALSDRSRLGRFLRRDAALHLYELGDLDERTWPRTAWHGWIEDGELRAVALLFKGLSRPTLLVLERDFPAEAARLLGALSSRLPDELYCHLSPGLAPVLARRYALKPGGAHLKMSLVVPGRLAAEDGAVPLSDADELAAFYDSSYPGHWFEPAALSNGPYVGLREEGRLVCAAGVHVYSEALGVAALGNVATAPAARGRGLARAAVSTLCRRLLRSVRHIGLNVAADNAAAVGLYASLGFARGADYEEYSALRR